MSGPSRPPRQRYRTARERVAARRGDAPRSPSRPRPAMGQRLRRPGCAGQLLLAGLVAGLALALLGVLLLGRTFGTLRSIEQQDPRQTAGTVRSQPDAHGTTLPPSSLTEPFTVLLLGVDLREDPEAGARSDTLIVVRVDPVQQWAAMLSIPRDSVTTIARTQGLRAKINYAYSYGYDNAAELYGANTDKLAAGGALAAETVEGFLGLKIDYIAQVDFHGFEQIVDTLGGVTVDVPQPLLDAEFPTENYGVERVYIAPGLQRFDGRTALRYARSRHADSDFGRSKRQQLVLRALLAEVRQKGILEQAAALPGLVQALERTVSTTMPISDPSVLSGLLELARSLSAERIVQVAINVEEVGLIAEDGSDLYWDEAGIKQQVVKLLAGPQASGEPARVQVQNGAGVTGIASKVSNYLSSQGFTLDAASDADGRYEHTLIIDYSDRPQTRQRLAALLGIAPDYILINPADRAITPPGIDIVVVIGADYRPEWLAE